MKKSRSAVLWVGVLGLAGATAASFMGCGSGDDNASPTPVDGGQADGTVDSGSDARSDAAAPDAGADATSVDGGADASGVTDSSNGDADAGVIVDARTFDAAFDAGVVDAGGQMALEAGAIDAATSMSQFAGQVAAAVCGRTAACCGFAPGSTAFDMTRCLNDVAATGFNGSNVGTQLIDGGNVAFDLTKAQTCLANISAVDCSANNISSELATVLYQSCFGALVGTHGTGEVCRDAIECTPGHFCETADAGDGGVCQPLRTMGQSCGDFGSNIPLAQNECSYRSSGDTTLWCDWFDLTAHTLLNPGAWRCIPDQGLGAACANSQECSSLLCDPGPTQNVNQCVAAEKWVYPSACAPYIVDAGAD